MTDQGHWTGLTVDPDKHFGFVYGMRDLDTNEFYVGRKNVWIKKQGVALCKSATPNILSSKWKPCCWKQSNWKTYNGSSKHWNAHRKEFPDHEYAHRVLACCPSKGILSFAELVAIVSSGAMTNPLGFNLMVSKAYRPNHELWSQIQTDPSLGWFY